MLYFCLLVYLAIVYIRPGEIIPGWVGFPFLYVVSIVSVVAATISLILDPRRFWNRPIDRFVLLFYGALVLSNPANGWFGGANLAFQAFLPIAFCYFLMRLSVRTPNQLRGVVVLIIALTLFQAANGIVQHYTGSGLGNVTSFTEAPGEDVSGFAEEGQDARIRGTGIFNDPNDLAMTLLIAVPFLLNGSIGRRKPVAVRLLSLGGLVPILTAMVFTLSRGGMLAAAAVFAHHAHRRWGRTAAVAVLAAGFIALGAMSSRLSQITVAEESAQGRVQAWSEGLQMFKTHPVLGVGYGQFGDYHERVGHNSFVHSLGDLGLVGGIAFVGLFYFFFKSAKSSSTGLSADIREAGLGLLVALMFLSRQYNILPYIVLALAGCLPPSSDAGGGDGGSSEAPEATVTALDLARIGGLTVIGILAAYVAVRLLAVWS